MHRSVSYLRRLKHYWDENLNPEDAPRRLALKSDYVEQRLVQILLSLSESGAALTTDEVVDLTETMASDLGTLGPDEHLGHSRLGGFRNRRTVLSSRVAEVMSALRARASPPELQRRYASFFPLKPWSILDSVLVKQNITADCQISSFDELHLNSSGTVGKPRVVSWLAKEPRASVVPLVQLKAAA